MASSFMDIPGLFLFGALAISLIVCVNADAIGNFLSAIDHPDQGRKRHAKATPLVGGLAILLPVLVWATASYWAGVVFDRTLFVTIILCGAGVGLVGLADDQSSTTPLSRMLALIVFLAVAFTLDPHLVATKLNWGSFSPLAISVWPYYLLVIVATTGLVNAVNMADGQNGVVLSMFIVWSGCLIIVGDGAISLLSAVIFMASLVVFCFNMAGRLFLGDCGTYGVTFIIALLVAASHAQGRITLETVIVWFFVPVMDCLRLVLTRPMRGKSPFRGDRDHFHHRLQDKLGAKMSFVSYASIVAVPSLLATVYPRFALVCLVVLAAVYFSFAWLTDSQVSQGTVGQDGKIVPIGGGISQRQSTSK